MDTTKWWFGKCISFLSIGMVGIYVKFLGCVFRYILYITTFCNWNPLLYFTSLHHWDWPCNVWDVFFNDQQLTTLFDDWCTISSCFKAPCRLPLQVWLPLLLSNMRVVTHVESQFCRNWMWISKERMDWINSINACNRHVDQTQPESKL